MARIKMIEPMVYEALTYHPETRGDNFMLYIEVLRRFDVLHLPLIYVFSKHKELGLPTLETITRVRRKLQKENPSLRDAKADEIRRKEAEEFYNYSKR